MLVSKFVKQILAVLAVGIGMVMATPAEAALVGLWEFEDGGDLAAKTVGTDLTLVGSVTAVAGAGGTDTGAASVDNGDHFVVTNPIGVNGGGATKTNEYTILMDINTASGTPRWSSLLQIDGAGDGDLFLKNAALGIEGDYFGDAGGNVWHRILAVFDLGSATPLVTYIDGVESHQFTIADLTSGSGDGGAIDGRWGLQGTFDAFQDNTSEERTTANSNLALFSTALSSAEAAALGNAGDAIPAVPEPSTLLLLGVASVGLFGIRRRQK